MAELTAQQMRFVEEFCIDRNGKQAAIRAGYSKNTAEQQASRLLSNVKVQEEIQAKLNRLSMKTEITAEWVLNELKDTYLQAKQMGEYAPANKSLELLGKHLGMFTDKVKMDVQGGLDNTTTDLTGLSPEERRARIDELNRRRRNGASPAS